MKTTILFILAFISSVSFAAEKKKVYNTHFENPIVDDRLNLDACAVDGALMGILEEDYGDILCWGTKKDDTAKIKQTIYIFKKENLPTLYYFEQIAYKDLGGHGAQEGGIRWSTVTLRTLGRDLIKPKKTFQSTLKFTTEWMYSEGSTLLEGRIPGKKLKISAPVFGLEMIDEELEQFAGEIGGRN